MRQKSILYWAFVFAHVCRGPWFDARWDLSCLLAVLPGSPGEKKSRPRCTQIHAPPRTALASVSLGTASTCIPTAPMLRICCVPTGVVGSGAFAAFSLSRSWGSGGWSQIPKTERSPFVENRLGQPGATSPCNAREAVAINTHSTRHTRIQVSNVFLALCLFELVCLCRCCFITSSSILIPCTQFNCQRQHELYGCSLEMAAGVMPESH